MLPGLLLLALFLGARAEFALTTALAGDVFASTYANEPRLDYEDIHRLVSPPIGHVDPADELRSRLLGAIAVARASLPRGDAPPPRPTAYAPRPTRAPPGQSLVD